IFGTICIGLFAKDGITGTATGNGLFYGGGFKLLTAQLTGIVTVGLFVFVTAIVAWAILKAVMGIRVSREEELRGLDIGEHGNEAYAGFQVFTTD
ncbi:MAG: ammonia permease, partial [Phycisphaerae bacterium]|nr:ammonia permease [Phycisphaerae bacterium]